ncbi:MAG: cobalamin biosynthesis protein [Bilophila sp.]
MAAVASCDLKADEPAILELVEKWHVPARFYDAATLDAVPVPTPSDKVREKIGTRSVSEAAALLGAGYAPDVTAQPHLYAPKAAFGDVTLALAPAPARQGGPEARRPRGGRARFRRAGAPHARDGGGPPGLRRGGRLCPLC